MENSKVPKTQTERLDDVQHSQKLDNVEKQRQSGEISLVTDDVHSKSKVSVNYFEQNNSKSIEKFENPDGDAM